MTAARIVMGGDSNERVTKGKKNNDVNNVACYVRPN